MQLRDSPTTLVRSVQGPSSARGRRLLPEQSWPGAITVFARTACLRKAGFRHRSRQLSFPVYVKVTRIHPRCNASIGLSIHYTYAVCSCYIPAERQQKQRSDPIAAADLTPQPWAALAWGSLTHAHTRRCCDGHTMLSGEHTRRCHMDTPTHQCFYGYSQWCCHGYTW